MVDPHADSVEVFEEYGYIVKKEAANDYDAVIVTVNHKEFSDFTEADLRKFMKDDKGVLVDIKGLYRGKISNMDYWSL